MSCLHSTAMLASGLHRCPCPRLSGIGLVRGGRRWSRSLAAWPAEELCRSHSVQSFRPLRATDQQSNGKTAEESPRQKVQSRPAPGGGGAGPPEPEDKQSETKAKFERFLLQVVGSAGLKGTIAVAAGLALRVDPLGHIHWSAADVMLGLQLAIPIVLLDLFFMAPNYAPAMVEKTVSVPAAAVGPATGALSRNTSSDGVNNGASAPAEQPVDTQPTRHDSSDTTINQHEAADTTASQHAAASVADPASHGQAAVPEDGREGPGTTLESEARLSAAWQALPKTAFTERTIPVRGPQPAWRAKLEFYQKRLVSQTPSSYISAPTEVVCILLTQLSQEMLQRAIVVGGLGKWAADRMYEADLEYWWTQHGGSYAEQPLTWLGQALAISVGLGVIAGFAVRKVVQRPVLMRAGVVGADGDQRKQKMERDLAELVKRIGQDHKVFALFTFMQDALEWVLLGAAYIKTGNLAAPYTAAVVGDIIYSALQRAKHSSQPQMPLDLSGLQSRVEVISSLKEFREREQALKRDALTRLQADLAARQASPDTPEAGDDVGRPEADVSSGDRLSELERRLADLGIRDPKEASAPARKDSNSSKDVE